MALRIVGDWSVYYGDSINKNGGHPHYYMAKLRNAPPLAGLLFNGRGAK